MFKKIIGLILILLAGLFTLQVLATSYRLFTEKNGGYEAAQQDSLIFDYVVLVILIVIIFFTIKFGLKLIMKKPKAVETIDEIGIEK